MIQDNYFHDNAQDFDTEIFLTSTASVMLRGNMRSVPTNFAWSKEIDYYRTHVQVTPDQDQLVTILDAPQVKEE